MKKPVADPNRWKVPSRNVWVTSKLQVTRSPWIFPLDRAAVSDIVSPPVGVNQKVTVNDWSTTPLCCPRHGQGAETSQHAGSPSQKPSAVEPVVVWSSGFSGLPGADAAV